MAKIIVEYDGDSQFALLIRDGAVEEHVCEHIAHFNKHGRGKHLAYGSQEPFMMWRVAIREGLIPSEDVEFMFDGEVVPHNSDGKINHWPTGLCNLTMKILERLL